MNHIRVKSRCRDCIYCKNLAPGINICDHGITDKKVFNPTGLTECSSWTDRNKFNSEWVK